MFVTLKLGTYNICSKDCGIIKYRGQFSRIAWLSQVCGMYFPVPVLSYSFKRKYHFKNLMYIFVENVYLWMTNTHEINENWGNTKSKNSTVGQIKKKTCVGKHENHLKWLLATYTIYIPVWCRECEEFILGCWEESAVLRELRRVCDCVGHWQ